MDDSIGGKMYLDLLKQTLTGSIYEDRAKYAYWQPKWQDWLHPLKYNAERRDTGKDMPRNALTMIGTKRINNVHQCVEDVLRNNIPGDLIETGVWRGGATILMKAILNVHGASSRRVWVADSFEGVPKPNAKRYPADRWLRLDLIRFMAVSEEQVRKNFEKFGLLDDSVKFLKGWFKDTLPSAPIEKLAVLRMDGDLYESTMDSLTHLYPKLSVGGYLIIDDYNYTACKQAVHEYRDKHGITDEILDIDGVGRYWKRTTA